MQPANADTIKSFGVLRPGILAGQPMSRVYRGIRGPHLLRCLATRRVVGPDARLECRPNRSARLCVADWRLWAVWRIVARNNAQSGRRRAHVVRPHVVVQFAAFDLRPGPVRLVGADRVGLGRLRVFIIRCGADGGRSITRSPSTGQDGDLLAMEDRCPVRAFDVGVDPDPVRVAVFVDEAAPVAAYDEPHPVVPFGFAVTGFGEG
jgi:hypothetical protein